MPPGAEGGFGGGLVKSRPRVLRAPVAGAALVQEKMGFLHSVVQAVHWCLTVYLLQ